LRVFLILTSDFRRGRAGDSSSPALSPIEILTCKYHKIKFVNQKAKSLMSRQTHPQILGAVIYFKIKR